MGGLAHLSDFLFEVPYRSDLNDRDPLVRAGVFARGSAYGDRPASGVVIDAPMSFCLKI
jgi:hypothetical protein